MFQVGNNFLTQENVNLALRKPSGTIFCRKYQLLSRIFTGYSLNQPTLFEGHVDITVDKMLFPTVVFYGNQIC
jgi:hypothetical protein